MEEASSPARAQSVQLSQKEGLSRLSQLQTRLLPASGQDVDARRSVVVGMKKFWEEDAVKSGEEGPALLELRGFTAPTPSSTPTATLAHLSGEAADLASALLLLWEESGCRHPHQSVRRRYEGEQMLSGDGG